jgi:hypothetical protein
LLRMGQATTARLGVAKDRSFFVQTMGSTSESRSDAGNVCPVVTVPLATYLANLAATRPDWVIDPS